MSNNREFLLTHSFKRLLDIGPVESATLYTADIPWAVALLWDRNSGYDQHVIVLIICGKETPSNMWSIDVKMKMSYGQDRSSFLRNKDEPEAFQFSQKAREYQLVSDVVSRDLVEYEMRKGPLLFECEMEIIDFTGITLKKKLSFESPLENLSDVLLKVEDKPFHVSKVILATHSPYFKSMFFGGFGEANKKEVVLKDVKAATFNQYLCFLYHVETTISNRNVAELLTMADLFGTSFIVETCEKFLISTSTKKMVEKLQLAEKFHLSELHSKCLNALSTKMSIKEVCAAADVLGESTLRAILKKVAPLL